ncbi:hemolysin activation/secretion protein-like protein [Anabaena sp. 90]|uniref:ShlB/FhaC/HecB family hemolysin secretion/activation protein n=1 Tax=Anabaena sp. 90 TaxID=46234 RepID=UPI00029B5D94|nr:ShlB/FhaC/HecB family hemolysin secretion/activation protein [Anabaena sp. 90]AFW94388.1 hemolysin activation/secretion protein-like protein [Anabaena sp. 90]
MNFLGVASTRITLETATKPHLFGFWRVIFPLVSIIVPSLHAQPLLAQIPPEVKPPSRESLPEAQPLPVLPPPDQLLPIPSPIPNQPQVTPETLSTTLVVERFEFVGNTVFSAEELAKVTAPYTKKQISFTELLQVRSQITKLYVDKGYVTSGAIIPIQTIKNGVVVVQLVEGSLEKINVTGTSRLNRSYISDRLSLAAGKPFSRDRLLIGLQLLQLDPLIKNISADLQTGIRPGTNILEVKVTEADSFQTQLSIDNERSPSVGSLRRRININEANLLGLGDGFNFGYTNTDGSNGIDISYSLPVNARNGKLIFNYGATGNNVIERPFNTLDITSQSRFYELQFRQPLVQTPTQEFTLGLTASQQMSQTFLGTDNIGPFPLGVGADNNGKTKISALRFFQEWSQRSSKQVLTARSQFSLGLNILDATINNDEPDSRFFSWRGQGQWLRQLAPDTILLMQTNLQLANKQLLGLEQFGLGGQKTLRGYRQDSLLTDNGFLASTEVRLPVLRVPKLQGLLQIAPFFDLGTGWNNGGSNPDNNTLLGAGLGLIWRQSSKFNARLDWGIPLTENNSKKETWQENGLYFSLTYSP